MRRFNQQMSDDECKEILHKNTSGVLSVIGDNGYPYAVPLSYVYKDNRIYFHCAVSGHKIDAIKSNDKVSFCIVEQDDVVAERYTTYYKSVIVFGKARILSDENEIKYTLRELGKKYAPSDSAENLNNEINSHPNLLMVEIGIEHMTGKKAKELIV